MRVAGGQWSGRRLEAPKGPRIRPTQDQVKQALFNLLGERVPGARVLDLFCGSGAMGIEALSRGAARAVFVDRSSFCIRTVRANLEQLPGRGLVPPVSPAAHVVRSDALLAVQRLARRGEVFDLVFLDPPYEGDLARKTLLALGRCAIVAPTGLVVAEHGKRDPLPAEIDGEAARLVVQRVERYGDTALAIYQRQ